MKGSRLSLPLGVCLVNHTEPSPEPSHAPVAQLVEAIGLDPMRWGFESLREYARLAQPAEALVSNASQSGFKSQSEYNSLGSFV